MYKRFLESTSLKNYLLCGSTKYYVHWMSSHMILAAFIFETLVLDWRQPSFLHNFVYFLNLLLKPLYSCSFYLQKEFPVRNTLSSYFLIATREQSELYFSFSNIVTRSVQKMRYYRLLTQKIYFGNLTTLISSICCVVIFLHLGSYILWNGNFYKEDTSLKGTLLQSPEGFRFRKRYLYSIFLNVISWEPALALHNYSWCLWC